jgi:hypothetical protein
MADMSVIEEMERLADEKLESASAIRYPGRLPPSDLTLLHDKLERLAVHVRHTMNLVITLCELNRVTLPEINAAYEATRQAEMALDRKGERDGTKTE